MKLTSFKTIQDGEKEFIDTINAELDWGAIEKILFEKHNLTLHDEIEYKNGDLLLYKDQRSEERRVWKECCYRGWPDV